MYLLSGRAVSHLEALLSEARSIAYSTVSYKELMRFVFFRFVLSVFNWQVDVTPPPPF